MGTTGTFLEAGYDSHGGYLNFIYEGWETSEMVSLVDLGTCITAARSGKVGVILVPLLSAYCIPDTAWCFISPVSSDPHIS